MLHEDIAIAAFGDEDPMTYRYPAASGVQFEVKRLGCWDKALLGAGLDAAEELQDPGLD